MHPLIARFLDLERAVATLERTGPDAAFDADELAFTKAARANARARTAVLKGKGRPTPSQDVQQALIVLATEAATSLVAGDPALGPKVALAIAALRAEGADAQQAQLLIEQVVLEEAFGYAEEPDHFDTAYVAETLDSLVPLAKVTSDAVDEWLEAFAKRGEAPQRALRLAVAEALLETAWGEGPQPITPEHVDDTIESLSGTVASSELARATGVLGSFLGFLAEHRLIGTERLSRLTHLVHSAAVAHDAGELSDGEEEDDEDEEE